MADPSQVLEWKDWFAKLIAFVLGVGGFKAYSMYTDSKKLPGEISHKEAETKKINAESDISLIQVAMEMVGRVKAENEKLYQEIEELKIRGKRNEEIISHLTASLETKDKALVQAEIESKPKKGNGKG